MYNELKMNEQELHNYVTVTLYKAIVRYYLEYRYCIQAWSPYLRKLISIDMVERIQRRATKLIPGLREEERLKECGLKTLETLRLKGGGSNRKLVMKILIRILVKIYIIK